MSDRFRALICPGGTNHGEVSADATGKHRKRCRDRRCQYDQRGALYHIFDMATGLVVDNQRIVRDESVRANTKGA